MSTRAGVVEGLTGGWLRRTSRLTLPLLVACWSAGCGSQSVTAGSDAAAREASAGDLVSNDLPDASGTVPSDGSSVADVGSYDDGARSLPDLGTDLSGIPDATPPDARSLDVVGGDDVGPVVDASGDAVPADRAAGDAPVRDGAGADGVAPTDATSTDAAQSPFRILVFSRTAAFRHVSIPTAIAALMDLQTTGGYVAEATEDPTLFTTANLARFQVVVFALTSGDVLNPAQQTAFESWIAGGGGYVGIHSASDTEYDWPFYGTLVGAYFRIHPAQQTATVRVEASTHPIMAGLPAAWVRRDEWYDFRTNPRPNVTVLATLDETTYTGGTMGADHPIIWAHPTASGGRSFYTALGHTPESYAEPLFRRHLVNGIRWAAKR
jgi:type 1 glutamine amidotransferase